MFDGIALCVSAIPLGCQSDQLRPRLHRRGPSADREAECWFLLRDPEPLLPVWFEGHFQLFPWGSLRTDGSRVWQCRQEALEAGKWAHLQPQEVLIPATFGWDSGVWYGIREGIRGVLVTLKTGPAVFVLTQPSTHYYEVMCARSAREPVFVGEVI